MMRVIDWEVKVSGGVLSKDFNALCIFPRLDGIAKSRKLASEVPSPSGRGLG